MLESCNVCDSNQRVGLFINYFNKDKFMEIDSYFDEVKPAKNEDLWLAVPFSTALFVHAPILYPFDTEYQIKEDSPDGYEWKKYVEGREHHTIELHEIGEYNKWDKEITEKYKDKERKINIKEKWKTKPSYEETTTYKINDEEIRKIIAETLFFGILDKNHFKKYLTYEDVGIQLTETQQELDGTVYWMKDFKKLEENSQDEIIVASLLEKREDSRGREWKKSFMRLYN